jgi:hypothetical protein
MQTTLKTKCTHIETPGSAGPGTTTLHFGPDYEQGRNAEWATATPGLNIVFTVRDEIADRWELHKAYTFTVSETED